MHSFLFSKIENFFKVSILYSALNIFPEIKKVKEIVTGQNFHFSLVEREVKCLILKVGDGVGLLT